MKTFADTFPDLDFHSTLHDGKPRYNPIQENIGQGGFGVVIKVEDFYHTNEKEKKPIVRAAKLLKPEHSQKEKVNDDFLEEIFTLSQINHPNVIRIYDWGFATCKKDPNSSEEIRIPFYIMEHIEGSDLEQYLLRNEDIPTKFFERLVDQTLSAVKCCHENINKITHLDIKPDNILVLENGKETQFILTDFGKAKQIEKLRSKYDTVGGGIFEYVHPKLWGYLRSNKILSAEIKEDFEQFDLYSLGIVYKKVFTKIKDFREVHNSLNPWHYLINDLCGYGNVDSQNSYKLLEIKFAQQALDIIKRFSSITERKEHSFAIKYNSKGMPVLRLPKKETIPLPSVITEMIDSLEFQKLRNISQLGVTDLTFPGATHTRFEHSLGTYHRIMFYLDSLFRNPVFNYLYDKKTIEALIVSGLLHDVGHYPFAHYIEEIDGLKNLKVKHEQYSKRIFTGELSLNNLIELSYSEKHFSKRKLSYYKTLIKNKETLHGIIKRHVDLDEIYKIWEGLGLYKPLKDIINGPIDCDKLDYLVRDSTSVGVPYGDSIDLDRFYHSITLDIARLPDIGLAITSKGKAAVESIISARYELFSEVYWHKTSRTSTAMIKDAFWYAHLNGNIKQEEFDWVTMFLNESEFLNWIFEKIPDDEIATDLLGGIRIFNDRQLYKRVRTYSYHWKEKEKIGLYQNFMQIGTNFNQIHTYKKRLVKELNKRNKGNPSWKQVKYHHVIIDIPNVKQDLYHHIQVKYPPTPEKTPYYSMQDISALSKAIYEDFAYSTKKVRIMCHPLFERQLLSIGNLLDITIKEVFEN